MVQAFAIASLHVRRAAPEVRDGKVVTPPKVEVVPAGSITDLSDDDFQAFEAAGAVRRATKIDRAMSEGDEPDNLDAKTSPEPKAPRKA